MESSTGASPRHSSTELGDKSGLAGDEKSSITTESQTKQINSNDFLSVGKTTRTLLSSRFSFCGYTSFLPLWSLIALEMPPRSNLESKLSEEQGPSLFILLQSALHTCGAREIMNNNNYMQPIWPLGPASGCKSIIWSSKAEITHCLPLTGSVWGAQSCNSAEKQWNEPQNLELDFVFFSAFHEIYFRAAGIWEPKLDAVLPSFPFLFRGVSEPLGLLDVAISNIFAATAKIFYPDLSLSRF